MMDSLRVGPWLVEPKLNAVSGSGKSIRVEPLFDPLRPDPRFQEFLGRMSFPP